MHHQESAATELANSISGTLRIGRAMIQAGRRLDLGGLEADVGTLCALCLDMPPAHGRALRARVADVLAELDALDATIRGMTP